MNLKKQGLILKKQLCKIIAVGMAVSFLLEGIVVQADFKQPVSDYTQSEAAFATISDNQVTTSEMTNENDVETELFLEEESFEGRTIVSENALAEEENLVKEESPFEKDRYNPIYYGEVVDRWPENNSPISLYMTPSQEKLFENYILKAISNFETVVDVTNYNIPADEMWIEIYHVLNNHPELYYATATSSYYNSVTNMAVGYVFTYMGTKDSLETQKSRFNAEVDKALAYVNDTMSDYEKALAVHDYIILNCEYDNEENGEGTENAVSHTAYGAMVDKLAVCDGYAKAFQYIMYSKLNIPCIVVTSSSMGHAWNLIQIDGKWYHTDLTWDDPVYDCIGRVTHQYFLLSDMTIGDEEHGHKEWQAKDSNKQDIIAANTVYDNYFWTEIASGMYKVDNFWYYTVKEWGEVKLVRDENLAVTGDETDLYRIAHEGNPAWTDVRNGSLARLAVYENRLYFNTPSMIKSIAMDGTDEKVEFVPNKTANQFVYGFMIQNGNMKYALRNNTGSAGQQEVCTIGLGSTSILSLTAKNYNSLDVVLNKVAKQANATESGYVLYRRTEWQTEWQTAALLPGENNCSFRDEGLDASTTYFYTARNYQVINGDRCYGPYSNVVSATTMAVAATPILPTQTSDNQNSSAENKAVKGKIYKVGKFKYKVTKEANGGTGKVTLMAPVKKTYTKLTVLPTVTIQKESFQVTKIAKNAFKNNKKLKTVVIGKNVTSIGANAFYGCKKLKTVTVKATKLSTIGKNAFKGIYKKAVIKVPAKKCASYKKLLKKKKVALPSKVTIKKQK